MLGARAVCMIVRKLCAMYACVPVCVCVCACVCCTEPLFHLHGCSHWCGCDVCVCARARVCRKASHSLHWVYVRTRLCVYVCVRVLVGCCVYGCMLWNTSGVEAAL